MISQYSFNGLKSLIFCLVFFWSSLSIGQFLGGIGDGFNLNTTGSTSINYQFYYCDGGIEDGYDQTYFNGNIFGLSFYCLGGNGDGYDFRICDNQMINSQDIYCSGGNGDGYDLNTMHEQGINDQGTYCSGGIRDGYDWDYFNGNVLGEPLYCLGGIGDGYELEHMSGNVLGDPIYCLGGIADGYDQDIFSGSVLKLSEYCFGGIGDGYDYLSSSELNLGYGIWKGTEGVSWKNPSNWVHDSVPGLIHHVTIPGSCLYYPLLFNDLSINDSSGQVECKNLDIQPGASLYTMAGINVAGNLNIEGNFINTLSLSNSQVIDSGGVVTIGNEASVRLGNASSGLGHTDLVVNNGGKLIMHGGYLEVDDQLIVESGAELRMDDGMMFINKRGLGSQYSFTNPGSFFMRSGATGNISGGTIKVCGRNPDGIFHAVNIREPSVIFTGTSTIEILNGDYPVHFNSGIFTASGAILNNLTINKTGKRVFAKSDLDVRGDLTITPGSDFVINDGFRVSIGEE